MSLAGRLRASLGPPLTDGLTGDQDWDRQAGAIPAAVLIAITDRSEPGVLLTVRRDDLRTHAGQIAFPGGRIDAGETPAKAAVREAWEELALDPAFVDVVGDLDPYRTITGFCVTPVLAVVPADLPLVPHDREVADWFEAPLAFLLDPARQSRQSMAFQGRTRHYHEINWEGRRIWGATAAMLVNLSRRLAWN
jgi:8-oxo-dGTP pyrophosphatase MutT (NUDIX family)